MGSRRWCFTEQNEEKFAEWRRRLVGDLEWPTGRGGGGILSYCVGQLESCPETGKRHLQGYCELKRPQRLSWLRSNLSDSAHWEKAMGSRDQARDYCRKDDTRVSAEGVDPGPWEWGEFQSGGQGKRSDLEVIAKRIHDGATIREVADEYPKEFIKHHKGFMAYKAINQKGRSFRKPHRVELHYGPPGCGKTWTVWEKYDPDEEGHLYSKPPNSRWFDSYDGQDVVLFDDFNTGWFSRDEFMQYMDRYHVLVQNKGGHYPLCNSTTVITTTTLPERWYDFREHPEQLIAMTRRISLFYVYIAERESVVLTDYNEMKAFLRDPQAALDHWDIFPRGLRWEWEKERWDPMGHEGARAPNYYPTTREAVEAMVDGRDVEKMDVVVGKKRPRREDLPFSPPRRIDEARIAALQALPEKEKETEESRNEPDVHAMVLAPATQRIDLTADETILDSPMNGEGSVRKRLRRLADTRQAPVYAGPASPLIISESEEEEEYAANDVADIIGISERERRRWSRELLDLEASEDDSETE